MIVSGGQLVLADTTPTFANTYYAPSTGLNLTGYFGSYQAIYRNQLMVFGAVKKLALGTARLPLKVYERNADGRVEVRNHPFARLLANPNSVQSAKHFWEWTVSTFNVFGEALWLKVRRQDGTPGELWPIHPINVSVRREDDGTLSYIYHLGVPSNPQFIIPQRDVVHFRSYNPDTTLRGLSPLEPLRMTLLNEDAARRATTAFWKNGARPAVALKHPGKLSPESTARLRANWEAVHQGVDNFAKAAVLEEGMEAQILNISNEDAQYVETRKLNREEVCIAYDIPPPVLHILDHATYSNITEQMRSMYRDTMAPRLQLLESDLDFQLRPDFGDDIYAEFLMDEVLRGDFESRMTAYTQAIGFGVLMPSEAREMENKPFIEGSDRLFINSTNVPLDVLGTEPEGQLTPAEARTVTDRASRRATLSEVDREALTAGLNGSSPIVIGELTKSLEAGEDVAGFCSRIWRHAHTDPVLELAKAVSTLAEKEVPAPIVNVEAPVVNLPEARSRSLERDGSGRILRIVEE